MMGKSKATRIARPQAVVLLACLVLVSGASQALSSAVINFRSVALLSRLRGGHLNQFNGSCACARSRRKPVRALRAAALVVVQAGSASIAGTLV